MLKPTLLPCRFLAFILALGLSQADALPRKTPSHFFNHRTKSVEVCPDLVEATQIAEANARSRSTKLCWRYVKRALVAANVVDSYPDGISAKHAGRELTQHHGFTKLNISNPKDAPVGAILVYGGKGYGHVEFRTEDGYVSDFKTSSPSRRPLTGVYVKTS
jgi:hypothetical protein